jgi:diguanylate cyclase (GGDEF)-like protein
MVRSKQERFEKRFRRRVLLPGALILFVTASVCGGALIAAGQGTDAMAALGQQSEVWRASARGMDELSVAQESVGLCEECIDEAGSAKPDLRWLHENVSARLFDLHHVHDTYILDSEDRPVFASVQRRHVDPSAYKRVAPMVGRFVSLARGETMRTSGRSNLNERLPGSPPEPMTLPPMPGFTEEPITLYPTVRTTPSVQHATDLVRIGRKIAFVSVMPMARTGRARSDAFAPPPVLVNLRYLDNTFLSEAARNNMLTGARIADDTNLRDGETSIPLMDSEGTALTNIFWQPLRPGASVIKLLLVPAAGVFGVIALLLLLMALRMRGLMKRDELQLAELEQAHLELTAKEAQAHHMAYHDALTGLPNRALFNDNADETLLRAGNGQQTAVVLLDLDRFKNVNDRFGHLAGDELIREVGERLLRVLRGKDAVARLGGDEFAILLDGEDLAGGIESTLDRILDDLHRPYEVLGNQAYVGVSMGVAVSPTYGTDRTDLMRKADIALYRAKADGRDCYRFFTESMDETVQLRAQLEEDLRACLTSGDGLSVHYQPLVDSTRRNVTGLEALLRWDHPQNGWVAPQLFVPVAEETGLIVQLGDWVLREICKVARNWPDLTIAINLSPIQFCDEGFAERTIGIVHDAGVGPHQIELEVTEGVVLDQNEAVRGSLRMLRQAGFRVALDDFGTGYSSLSYLRDFEVDRIKIDKSFVHSLGRTMDANAIITAVVTLGHAMGLQVTAEGVETADQEEFLRAAGCNVLQGFLFSKPVPADELSESLREYPRKAA